MEIIKYLRGSYADSTVNESFYQQSQIRPIYVIIQTTTTTLVKEDEF